MLSTIINGLKENPKDTELMNEVFMHLLEIENEAEIDDVIEEVANITEISCEEWKDELNKKMHKANLAEDGQNEKEATRTSFYHEHEFLAEQIYRNGVSLFKTFNAETEFIGELESFGGRGSIYEPVLGDELATGVVKLPSDAVEYGSTNKLLEDIEQHIYSYLDISSDYVKIASYYILLTWMSDHFQSLPYLRALGETGCGKSRFINVIGGLCYKPTIISGVFSLDPIYSLIAKWKGTLLIDGLDLKNSDENSNIVKVLNCSFEKNRPIIKTSAGNKEDFIIHDLYGPKILTSREPFKDQALESRCLTEVMRETSRTDIPYNLNYEFYQHQQELKNKLLLYRLTTYHFNDPSCWAKIDLSWLEEGRLKQMAESVFQLLCTDQKGKECFQEFLTNYQRSLVKQRSESEEAQVVQELLNQKSKIDPLEQNNKKNLLPIAPGDIANEIDLKAVRVGQIINKLGLTTKKVRVSSKTGTKNCIVNDEEVMEKLRRRYIV